MHQKEKKSFEYEKQVGKEFKAVLILLINEWK